MTMPANTTHLCRFTKETLRKQSGGYISYYPPVGQPIFIARFKYMKRNMGPFMTFLRKNFTVHEYLERMANDESPLKIVESKGYIAGHIKAQIKKAGYPVTEAGKADWWTAEMKKSDEIMAKIMATPEYKERAARRQKELKIDPRNA